MANEAVQTSGQRVIEYNGGKLTPITHANAREMQAKSAQARRNKTAQAARKRLLAELAAIDPTITDAYDAAGYMIAATGAAVVASAADGKPRGDDMIRVLQGAGIVPMAHEREQAQAQAGATLTLSPDIARALVDQLVQARASVVDGQVVADGQGQTGAETDKEQG